MILAGSTISNPHEKTEVNDVISVTHRSLSGKYTRDFIGSSKKIFKCQWSPISNDDFGFIYNHFVDQRDNGTTKNLTWAEVGFNGDVIIVIDEVKFPYSGNYTLRNFNVTFIEV